MTWLTRSISRTIPSRQLEILAEQKRLDVVEARKSEESLNILKNKEIDRFNEEEKDKERHFQDDIYISQGFRQRRSEV